MKTVRCVSRHAEDLADGGVLAPGDEREIDETDPHHARLIADGALVVLVERAPSKRTKAEREAAAAAETDRDAGSQDQTDNEESTT